MLQEARKTCGRGVEVPMMPSGLFLAGAAATIFWAAVALPCLAADDAFSVLKAQTEMLGSQAKAYTDFLKDIGLAVGTLFFIVGTIVVFIGIKTYSEMRASIKTAIESVRIKAEDAAKRRWILH
jgi:hypothetical protein